MSTNFGAQSTWSWSLVNWFLNKSPYLLLKIAIQDRLHYMNTTQLYEHVYTLLTNITYDIPNKGI